MRAETGELRGIYRFKEQCRSGLRTGL